MQRKNHLRLILGIILIGSLAVLLIGYFALRKPADQNPSMPAYPHPRQALLLQSCPPALQRLIQPISPQRPSHPQKGLLLTRRHPLQPRKMESRQ